jgi:hypothetical protein
MNGACTQFNAFRVEEGMDRHKDYFDEMEKHYICGDRRSSSVTWVGDEGGPLMPLLPDELEGDVEGRPSRRIQRRGRWYQVGVAGRSMGHAGKSGCQCHSLITIICFHARSSGQFARVADHCDWLKDASGGEVECVDVTKEGKLVG